MRCGRCRAADVRVKFIDAARCAMSEKQANAWADRIEAFNEAPLVGPLLDPAGG